MLANASVAAGINFKHSNLKGDLLDSLNAWRFQKAIARLAKSKMLLMSRRKHSIMYSSWTVGQAKVRTIIV